MVCLVTGLLSTKVSCHCQSHLIQHQHPQKRTHQVLGVRFATDRETGEFRGFGHVDFADENGPEAAVAMAGTPVSRAWVAVCPSTNRSVSSYLTHLFFLPFLSGHGP
jgi:hypothetical protein